MNITRIIRSMKPFFRVSLAVWFVATLFYAAGVLSVVMFEMGTIPVLDLFWFVAAMIAQLLYDLTRLPVPVLLMFNLAQAGTPQSWQLQGLTGTGTLLVALGVINVIVAVAALLKVADRKNPASRAWLLVFVYLSVLSYGFSTLGMIVGTCPLIGDFGGTYYCPIGVPSAVPSLIASTVLAVATAVIYRTVSYNQNSDCTIQ